MLELHGSTGSATITVPPQYAEKLVAVTDSLPSRLVTDGGPRVERLYCELCDSEFESLDELADHPGCGPTHEEDEEGEDGGRVAVADGGRSPLAAWSQLTGFKRDILRVLGDDARYGLAIKEQLGTWWGEEINHGRLYPNLDQLVEEGLVTKAELDKRTNEYALTDWGATVVSVALGRDDDLAIGAGDEPQLVADGSGVSLPEEHLEKIVGPEGSMEVFYCPDCGRMNDPESLQERGSCSASDCDWIVDEDGGDA